MSIAAVAIAPGVMVVSSSFVVSGWGLECLSWLVFPTDTGPRKIDWRICHWWSPYASSKIYVCPHIDNCLTPKHQFLHIVVFKQSMGVGSIVTHGNSLILRTWENNYFSLMAQWLKWQGMSHGHMTLGKGLMAWWKAMEQGGISCLWNIQGVIPDSVRTLLEFLGTPWNLLEWP